MGKEARKKNKKARLRFAKEHSSWTPEDWAKVLFSDESKFNMMGSDGKNYVSRRLGEKFSENCVIHTVTHGGGFINVWAAFRTAGVGSIYRIPGVLDGNEDVEILDDAIRPYCRQEFGGNFKGAIIFQQDNNQKHTCRVVNE